MDFLKKMNTNIALIPLVAVCVYCIIKAVGFQIHDFANYYFGAELLMTKSLGADIYFPHIFNLEIAALGYQNIFVSYAPNTPFLATLFYPLTFFSVAMAKIIFNSISLVLFLFSLRRLVKAYPVNPLYLLVLPLVFFIPLRNNFMFGQVYLLLFFLLSEGFLAYKKEAYLKMSLFWSVAILFKVFPILLFGMLLFRKKYKAFTYLSLACLVLFGCSLLISGHEVWEFYFTSVLPKSGKGEIASEFVQNYQSMFMFLKYSFPSNIVVFSMLLFVFKISLIALSFIWTKQLKSNLKIFSFWMLFIILWSPYGSTYSLLLLLFPFIFYSKKVNKKSFLLIVFLFVINTIPIHYFSGFSIPFSFPRLWVLLLLIVFVISTSEIQFHWKKSLLIIVPITIIYFFGFLPKENTTTLKTVSKKHILTYDYKIENGNLSYIYWDDKGEHSETTAIKVKTVDSINISLQNNQLFYKNKQLTFTKSNKLKPAVLNDSILVYLSDFKKGIGFYSIHISPFDSKSK